MIYTSNSQLEDVLLHLKRKFSQKGTDAEVISNYHNAISEYLSRNEATLRSKYDKAFKEVAPHDYSDSSKLTKAAQESLKTLILAYQDEFKLFNNIMLSQLPLVYAKVKELVQFIPNSDARAKAVLKFWEAVFDQSQVKHLVYANNLPVLSAEEQVEFFSILVSVLSDIAVPSEHLSQALSELYTYSGKHNHSSAKMVGVGFKPAADEANLTTHNTPMFNTAQNPGANVFAGAVGGGVLRDYPTLATIFPYVIAYKAEEEVAQFAVYEILKLKFAYLTTLGFKPFVLTALQNINTALQSTEREVASSVKARFITLDGQPCAIVPSNLLLEQLSLLRDACADSIQAHRFALEAAVQSAIQDKQDALLADALAKEAAKGKKAKPASKIKIAKFEKNAIPTVWTRKPFEEVGIVASNPQNVSALYSKLFSRGLPRFAAYAYIKESSQEDRSAYRFLKFGYSNLCQNFQEAAGEELARNKSLQGFAEIGHLLPNSARKVLSESVESIACKIFMNTFKRALLPFTDEKVLASIERKAGTFKGDVVLRDILLQREISEEALQAFVRKIVLTSLKSLALTADQKQNISDSIVSKIKEVYHV